MKRSVLILIAFVLAVVLVALIPSPGVTDGDVDNENDAEPSGFSGSEQFAGFNGDPADGTEPSNTVKEVELRVGATEAAFTLTWTDDEPDSDPDEFMLTVSGTVSGEDWNESAQGSTGTISVTASGNLGPAWRAEVTLLDAGDSAGGITGINPLLAQADTGNDWDLAVEYSGKETGMSAPDFSVTDIDGKTFTLSDHAGSVVIIDLTMRCSPCVDQVQELRDLDSQYGSEVAIISIDTTGASDDTLRKFRDENGAEYPFARDTDKVVKKYRMTTMRKLIIIDPSGSIVFEDPEVVTTEKLANEVNSALEGRSSALSFGAIGLVSLSFLAGVSVFFAPCALPLLPGYLLAYVNADAGGEDAHEEKPSNKVELMDSIGSGAAIGLGAALFYLALGALFIVFGSALAAFLPAFGIIAAIILIIVGIAFVAGRHPSWSMFLYRLRRLLGVKESESSGNVSRTVSAIVDEEDRALFGYGLGYGAASSACHGIVFASIVLLAVSGGLLAGIQAVLIFSAGILFMLALVFVLAAFAREKLVHSLISRMKLVNRISGVLMAIAGVWIIFYLM